MAYLTLFVIFMIIFNTILLISVETMLDKTMRLKKGDVIALFILGLFPVIHIFTVMFLFVYLFTMISTFPNSKNKIVKIFKKTKLIK